VQDTIPSMVLQQARRLQGRPALQSKESGHYRDILWDTVAAEISGFARGLLALGLHPGERVAIMSPNCPTWAYADLGIMAVGAVSVPVYHTEGIPTALHILRDSGSRFLVLHSPVLGEDLLPHLGEVPNLELIILLNGEIAHPAFLTLAALLLRGEGIAVTALEQRLAAGAAEDLATIIYTSGTTGMPKGAMLSHRNLLSNVEACSHIFPVGPGDCCLSFLPLSHVFERMAGYYFMLSRGAVIAYAENSDSVPTNLQEVHPTILISVPRLYEKMYARILERALASSWLRRQIFFAAVHAGRAFVHRQIAGKRAGLHLRLAIAVARHLVFNKLRAPLGGSLRFFVSGGAPLARDIAEFFLAADLPIYEGYGLTETSPVLAANYPGHHRPGTVGPPLGGTEIRIAEDEEILARGPGVFSGYWNDAATSAAAFDDGWFRTGDIGKFDADGFLVITDRKKDLIVTAGGENVAPQNIESLFKTNKFVSNAMVYGDRKPFLTALIVPNFENIEKFARSRQISFLNHCDLVNHPLVLELVRQQIDQLQHGQPPFQQIRRFTLISRDFSADEITPTLKLRRKLVIHLFHQVLEEMYQPHSHGIHDSGFCAMERPPQ